MALPNFEISVVGVVVAPPWRTLALIASGVYLFEYEMGPFLVLAGVAGGAVSWLMEQKNHEEDPS